MERADGRNRPSLSSRPGVVSEKKDGGLKMITNKTKKGTEQYWEIPGVFSYGFLANNGSLFQCVKKTLEECRAARDIWLRTIEGGNS